MIHSKSWRHRSYGDEMTSQFHR